MIRLCVVTSSLTAVLLLTGPCYCQDQATIWSIVDVLRRDHLSGSLEYRGRCGDENEYVTSSFPFTTTPTNYSAPPLQILREMFAKDEDMQVTQEPDGTIRMVEKAAPKDLLNVKIGHISCDDWQKKGHGMFSPPLVLSVIVGAPEVQAFMKGHGINQ